MKAKIVEVVKTHRRFGLFTPWNKDRMSLHHSKNYSFEPNKNEWAGFRDIKYLVELQLFEKKVPEGLKSRFDTLER